MGKTAVILFNLGGPDSHETIAPFLMNFFTDPNIVRAPWFVRWPLAKYISVMRSRREAGSAYARLGYKSPLLENTRAQAQALQEKLGRDYRVFVSMRCWHPMADEVARAVKDYAPEKIVLLPLYPQFSTTTTRSSFQSWDRAAKKAGLVAPVVRICCYPLEAGFIAASARLVREACDAALRECGRPPRILFSAHGLPEVIVRDGDPYQWQCEESAKAIVAAVRRSLISEPSPLHSFFSSPLSRGGDQGGGSDGNIDWSICYQSRVGRLKWIGPSTEEELRRAGEDGVPVVVYPHAFVSEHVETLVEIEEEYRHMAAGFGVPYFARVPTVGTAPEFIAGLASMVSTARQGRGILSSGVERLCPGKCGCCPLAR